MKNPIKRILGRLLRSDRRGSVLIYGAFSATALVGCGGIVVDTSYAFQVKRALQASTDAAVIAGASQLSSGASQAVSTATSYSSATGDKNAISGVTVSANAQTVNCTGSTGGSCTVTTTNPNGVKVTQTATVPLYFMPVLGINNVSISTTSFALQTGGKAQNTDIMIIVDTTASMNSTDSACSATREDCALAGFRSLLQGFTPSIQHVGLMIFPGLKTTTAAAQEYDCSGSTPGSSNISDYNASGNPPTTTPPVYLIVGLSSDYNNNGTLNTSSNLVKAARGGGTGCNAGVTAIGGVGTFYANAVTAAANYLSSNGRAGANQMIILLSDGDASAGTAPTYSKQCHQAITASTTAQTAGVTVVTIGYGSPGAGSCSTDSSPSITACQTLLDMATVGTGTTASPQWFYSDSASACHGSNSASNLSAIFTSIGTNVTAGGARLITS